MDQVAGIKLLETVDGNERGSRVLLVWTGSALCFHVLANKGLDISSCWYGGTAIAWASPSGDVPSRLL